jgi:hypothetical protein
MITPALGQFWHMASVPRTRRLVAHGRPHGWGGSHTPAQSNGKNGSAGPRRPRAAENAPSAVTACGLGAVAWLSAAMQGTRCRTVGKERTNESSGTHRARWLGQRLTEVAGRR